MCRSGSATSDADYSIGGAIDPAYYSTTGAFNGSGIALASQSFSSNITAETQGSIVMYYQHYTGEIRWKELSSSGEWVGGTISETVTADARNSTPLSAVSYSSGGMNTWHIFCKMTTSCSFNTCLLTLPERRWQRQHDQAEDEQ